jgi:hypothetical protein
LSLSRVHVSANGYLSRRKWLTIIVPEIAARMIMVPATSTQAGKPTLPDRPRVAWPFRATGRNSAAAQRIVAAPKKLRALLRLLASLLLLLLIETDGVVTHQF